VIPGQTEMSQRFLSFAYWLQRIRFGKPIMLPGKVVVKFFGCGERWISSLCQFAIDDGFLIKTKPSSFGIKGTGNRATEYRFAIEKFPEMEANDDASGDHLADPSPAQGETVVGGASADSTRKR
jgi:hypothetical protein